CDKSRQRFERLDDHPLTHVVLRLFPAFDKLCPVWILLAPHHPEGILGQADGGDTDRRAGVLCLVFRRSDCQRQSTNGQLGKEGDPRSRYSLADFVQRSAQQSINQGLFELEGDRTLEVNLNGMIWTKTGS